MFKFLKLYRMEILVFVLIAVGYFILRIPNLTLQPIFADEAIYIRWAQLMKAEPTLRFISLTDGKTPLFMWLMTPLFKVFSDPLLAGRFLSVLSGFVTLSGVLFLGWKFFNKQSGIWAAVLVTIVPFMVFFDRMALVDSMLAAFSIWSLNLALLLIKYPRIDISMTLGYVLGGGLLTKPPGFFNILVLPVSLVIFNWKSKNRQWKFLKIFGLWIIAIVVMGGIYSILKLGPGYSGLAGRNEDYIFSPIDIINRPWDPFLPHLANLVDWLPKLLTLPVLALIVCGSVSVFIKKNKYGVVVLLWSLLPLFAQMVLLKTFTARYILFSVPPLLFLGGWGIFLISQKFKKNLSVFVIGTLAVILPLSLFFDFRLLTNPSLAPLPQEERRGYLEDWTAGYGLKEIAQFLINESNHGLVVVGTEGSFGTLPDGLEIYLDTHSHQAPADRQVVVIGGGPTVSGQLRQAALDHPTFFIANRSRYPQSGDAMKLLQEYFKAFSVGNLKDAIVFYRVFPLNQ
ncbi:MAG: glycosyltransferase family 39 protein [Patescibacteria group bacterium]|nr:glycosyltransferase family 39 protein [Patescibacteria group bacterium]